MIPIQASTHKSAGDHGPMHVGDPAATSVLLVDDHPIVLQGCRRVLHDLGIETLYEATSVVEGYRSFLRHRPDVVIADLTYQGDDLGGLSLIRRIATSDRQARILVFSMHNDPAIVSRALESGALSYVLKDTPSAELVTAFEKVLVGEPHLTHKLAMQVAMLRSRGQSTATSNLTTREVQILSLLSKGNSYDKIASKLGISYKTVTNACSAMRAKLKIQSLAELIRFAINNDPDRVVLDRDSSLERSAARDGSKPCARGPPQVPADSNGDATSDRISVESARHRLG